MNSRHISTIMLIAAVLIVLFAGLRTGKEATVAGFIESPTGRMMVGAGEPGAEAKIEEAPVGRMMIGGGAPK